MSILRYQQAVVGDVEVSEVWGLIDAAPSSSDNDKRDLVVREWLERHAALARANHYAHCRASVDPTDPGHLLFEAWTVRPADEGLPRWAEGGVT